MTFCCTRKHSTGASHLCGPHRGQHAMHCWAGKYREAVSKVDFVHNPDMLRIAGVIVFGGHPLVGCKVAAGLQHPEHLSIHLFQLQETSSTSFRSKAL